MYCPECNSDIVVERDCFACGGFGYSEQNPNEICQVCDGVGSIPGEYECLECGHEWDE